MSSSVICCWNQKKKQLYYVAALVDCTFSTGSHLNACVPFVTFHSNICTPNVYPGVL